jgi:large subunit ribosomal protein L24
MKTFSKAWIKSKKPGKQRKYRANAPIHKKRKMMSGHLSEDLRKEHKKHAFPIRTDDKVKILRGEFKGTIGKVERIDVKNMKIFVAGAERVKGEGQPASKYPIDPSNVKIITLELKDKQRKEALKR